MQLYYNKL